MNYMLAKVGAHGIAGDLLKWINDWTKGRRQRVVLNGENSEWIKVTSSVVQGSVLGPVLFLMYINCLDIAVRAHDDQILVSKFADDSKIGRAIRHPKDTESLQQAIENLTKWCDKWGMEIHPEKSLVIHFGQNNQNADYKIGHTRVAAVECARDLGVYINNSCSSSEHVSYIAKKAHRVLSQLRRATTLRDSTFAKLYQVYVRPLMEASAPAWNPTKREDVNTLEKVQRRALRMVTSLGAATYEEKLSILGMQSLEDRRRRGDQIQCHKIVSGSGEVKPENYFSFVQDRHSANTRQHEENHIVIEKCHKNVRKNFFSNRVVKEWNELPQEVKNAQTTNMFKNRYDEHLKENRL